MPRAKRNSSASTDDSDLFSDQEFDLPNFIDSMETETKHGKSQRKAHRKTRQRLDDWREARMLRHDLQDWSDWD